MVETIALDPGEDITYDLEDGETFENVLIDQREPLSTYSIRARQKSGWTIRNVGWLGAGYDGNDHFHTLLSCPSGGSGLVENIYIYGKDDAPGSVPDGQDRMAGNYIRKPHAGDITFRRSYVEGSIGGIYGSACGKDGGGNGRLVIENCFHRDNTSYQFRIGTPDSAVRNCVGVVDDPQGLRTPYPGSGSLNARGVWGKHFPDQRVENSSFVMTPRDVNTGGVFEARYITGRSDGRRAQLTANNCDVNADAPVLTGSTSNATVEVNNLGNNPSLAPLGAGVPTSPEDAANGILSLPSGDQVPDALVDTGTGGGNGGGNGNGNGEEEPVAAGVSPEMVAAVLIGAGVAGAYLGGNNGV